MIVWIKARVQHKNDTVLWSRLEWCMHCMNVNGVRDNAGIGKYFNAGQSAD